jgi:hypothetical protein
MLNINMTLKQLDPPKGPIAPPGSASHTLRTSGLEEKFFASAADGTPVVQSVVRNYTDSATTTGPPSYAIQ